MISSNIKDWLVDEGFGTFGTDIFVSKLPSTPDNCICVYDEPAVVGAEHQHYDLDNLGFEIIVRGSYSYAESKIKEIHKKIVQAKGTYGGIYIKGIYIQTMPAQFDVDDKERRLFSAHYETEASLGATSRTAT